MLTSLFIQVYLLKMLTIVDYGVGNLAYIKNMLKRIGVKAAISSNE